MLHALPADPAVAELRAARFRRRQLGRVDMSRTAHGRALRQRHIGLSALAAGAAAARRPDIPAYAPHRGADVEMVDNRRICAGDNDVRRRHPVFRAVPHTSQCRYVQLHRRRYDIRGAHGGRTMAVYALLCRSRFPRRSVRHFQSAAGKALDDRQLPPLAPADGDNAPHSALHHPILDTRAPEPEKSDPRRHGVYIQQRFHQPAGSQPCIYAHALDTRHVGQRVACAGQRSCTGVRRMGAGAR